MQKSSCCKEQRIVVHNIAIKQLQFFFILPLFTKKKIQRIIYIENTNLKNVLAKKEYFKTDNKIVEHKRQEHVKMQDIAFHK